MEKLTADESAIWVYNALDVVFSLQDRADIFRLQFPVSHEREYSDGSLAFEPLCFTDIIPCQIAELTAFTDYLRQTEIDYEQGTNEFGNLTITTDGVISKFGKVLHHNESVEAGRAIRSEHHYLGSMTVRTGGPEGRARPQ